MIVVPNADLKLKAASTSYGDQEDIPRVRILFDAEYDDKTFRSASGLVGWDLRGNLTVLKTVFHSNIPSSFAAEACVFRWYKIRDFTKKPLC
ncbi:hypothetical protein Gotur_011906 [Gossypium turneri]